MQPVQPVVVKAEDPSTVAKTSQTLESILISAQKLADGAVDDARRKADLIVKEAEDKASGIIDDAKEEKATLEKSVEALRTAATEYKKNFMKLIEDQKTLLEGDVSLFPGA